MNSDLKIPGDIEGDIIRIIDSIRHLSLAVNEHIIKNDQEKIEINNNVFTSLLDEMNNLTNRFKKLVVKDNSVSDLERMNKKRSYASTSFEGAEENFERRVRRKIMDEENEEQEIEELQKEIALGEMVVQMKEKDKEVKLLKIELLKIRLQEKEKVREMNMLMEENKMMKEKLEKISNEKMNEKMKIIIAENKKKMEKDDDENEMEEEKDDDDKEEKDDDVYKEKNDEEVKEEKCNDEDKRNKEVLKEGMFNKEMLEIIENKANKPLPKEGLKCILLKEPGNEKKFTEAVEEDRSKHNMSEVVDNQIYTSYWNNRLASIQDVIGFIDYVCDRERKHVVFKLSIEFGYITETDDGIECTYGIYNPG
jgi:hypothetical protein